MSEVITLYQIEDWAIYGEVLDVDDPFVKVDGDASPVGEFVERAWCNTHNAEGVENHGGGSAECWRVVWADTQSMEGVSVPYELCRISVRLVQTP